MAQANRPIPTLPLNLMMMSGWLSSLPGWPNAKTASPHWKPPQSPANALPPNLQRAAADHASEVLKGLLRYLDAPYQEPVTRRLAVWKKGSSRLLDYSSPIRGGARRGAQNATSKQVSPHPNPPPTGEGNIVLFIPPLINRYYILDLSEERSLLQFLAQQGQHPLVLDWGTPGTDEKDFACEDYIQDRLLPAIRYISKTHKKPVVLAGYCMGGVFSLAAAQLLPKEVSALALLATPWDFHCKEFAPFLLDSAYQQQIDAMLDKQEMVPASMIQALFYMTDPFVFEHKFRRFYGLDPQSREAEEFIALEHWVNDGVPMTVPLAKECLLGWAQQNNVARGVWRVTGEKIDPKKIKQPVFIAVPQNDHIVPQDCAIPLAYALSGATVAYPDAGHVSMIVGNNAKKELWQPLLGWLHSC